MERDGHFSLGRFSVKRFLHIVVVVVVLGWVFGEVFFSRPLLQLFLLLLLLDIILRGLLTDPLLCLFIFTTVLKKNSDNSNSHWTTSKDAKEIEKNEGMKEVGENEEIKFAKKWLRRKKLHKIKIPKKWWSMRISKKSQRMKKIFERNLSSWSRWYNRNWYWFDFKHENK